MWPETDDTELYSPTVVNALLRDGFDWEMTQPIFWRPLALRSLDRPQMTWTREGSIEVRRVY